VGPRAGPPHDGLPLHSRNFTRDSELDAFEQTAFLVDVPAKAGGLVMVLDAIAQAGINIETIQSITDDRSLAAILWVDEADEPHLQQVLSRE
jgi:prephenate dehydratase